MFLEEFQRVRPINMSAWLNSGDIWKLNTMARSDPYSYTTVKILYLSWSLLITFNMSPCPNKFAVIGD